MKYKKSEKKLLVLEIFMIVLFLVNLIFLGADNYIIAMAIIVMFFISTFVLGYEDDRHRFKKDGILFAIIFSLAYEIFIYVSGIFVGFLRSGYSLSLFSFFQNVLPFTMIIITSETLRHEFMVKGEKKKIFYFLTLLLFVLIDTSSNMFKYNVTSSRVILEVICLVVIPSISKNLLLTYWMKRFGILANVIFLSITSLLIFIIPIIPDFNKYLQAVISLVYPIIVFFITRRVLKDNPKSDKKISKLFGIILFVFSVLLVILTSGIFKYYFLTIGSGSMQKELYVGDVVIVKKLKPSEYKEIRFLELKLDDFLQQPLFPKFEVAYKFIKINSENNILIFCGLGMSRSASLVLFYLMKDKGWDYDTSYNYTKERRPEIWPNPGFEQQLRDYYDKNIKE